VREHLGEEAELLARDSATLGARARGGALLRGGLRPTTSRLRCAAPGRARSAPTTSTRPSAGARCAARARRARASCCTCTTTASSAPVGTCFNSRGEDCVRCQGRDTLPGVRLNCRGTGAEAAVYAPRWRCGSAASPRRPTPSSSRRASRRERLRALRAPIDPARVHVVPHVVRDLRRALSRGGRRARARRRAPGGGEGRRSRGRGVRARGCSTRRRRRRPAGRRAARGRPRALRGARVGAGAGRPARRAALAIVPSRSAETFGLAAAEAMADGVPVVATAVGALPELVGPTGWWHPATSTRSPP
jgi:hypothetical protein